MTASRAGFDIRVCRGRVCAGQRDADAIYEHLLALVDQRGGVDPTTPVGEAAIARSEIWPARWSCFGRCQFGPNVHVRQRRETQEAATSAPPEGQRRSLSALYHGVARADIAEIIARHVDGGEIVTRLLRPLQPNPSVEISAGPYQTLAVRGGSLAEAPRLARSESPDDNADSSAERESGQDLCRIEPR